MQRLKQKIVSFDRSCAAATIDINEYSYGRNDQMGVHNLIQQIACCDVVDDQARAIQSQKGILRKHLAESVSDDFDTSVELLVHLYLKPGSFILRKHFEWLLEALIRRYSSAARTLDVVRKSCLRVWRSPECISILDRADGLSIDVLMAWTTALSCMATFDKEIPWLDNGSLSLGSMSLEIDDQSLLLEFVSTVHAIFCSCTRTIFKSQTGDSSCEGISTSAELMRLAECCGESMRGIMIVLKSRKSVSLSRSNNTLWTKLIDSIVDEAIPILSSEKTYKDVITATAMTLICMQWLGRRSFISSVELALEPTLPGLQVTAMLMLLSDGILEKKEEIDSLEGIDSVDKSTSSSSRTHQQAAPAFAAYAGIHPGLIAGIPCLPYLARCALLRAIMSVYPDSAMFFCPSNSPLNSTYERVVCEWMSENSWTVSKPFVVPTAEAAECSSNTLILHALFDATKHACNHTLPDVRLYGLQTLETWFNRSTLIVIPEVGDGTLVLSHDSKGSAQTVRGLRGRLIERLMEVSSMLTSSWNHPVKQVGEIPVRVKHQMVCKNKCEILIF